VSEGPGPEFTRGVLQNFFLRLLVEASICRLVSRSTNGSQKKLLSIRLELSISHKLVLKISSIFSRNKLMIPIVLFLSLWMFFYGWCSPATWTSQLLNSQTTWLKVKL